MVGNEAMSTSGSTTASVPPRAPGESAETRPMRNRPPETRTTRRRPEPPTGLTAARGGNRPKASIVPMPMRMCARYSVRVMRPIGVSHCQLRPPRTASSAKPMSAVAMPPAVSTYSGDGGSGCKPSSPCHCAPRCARPTRCRAKPSSAATTSPASSRCAIRVCSSC